LMPTQLTYPGVYIEEISSGVRTITGVATSITAFIGRTLRGPVDNAVTINSFADFERIFGGLWAESYLGFAVRDFYLNGGSQAIIVRLFQPRPVENGPYPNRAKIKFGTLFSLEAANEGEWGNNLRASIDIDVLDDVATRMGLIGADLFNLTVTDIATGKIERHSNLSFKSSPRRIDKVLETESQMVRWIGKEVPTIPDNKTAITAMDDDINATEKLLSTAKKELAEETKKDKPDDAVIAKANAAIKKLSDEINAAKKANFASNGQFLENGSFKPLNAEKEKKGLYALEQVALFNLLCIPPYSDSDVDPGLISEAAAYCEKRRAMLLVDPPKNWTDKEKAKGDGSTTGVAVIGTNSKNAAIFFPRLVQNNPLHDNQKEDFVPSGAVAGVFARTDTQRGVWKAPAGLDATLVGVLGLKVNLTDPENGELNQLGINCLRSMPAVGNVIWGSRTLQGDDRMASEWKYIPVRRTALFIEESLYRGTQWVVFEPNDEPLWAQIRLNIGAFMHNLFRQGAFQGSTPKEAYFVKCDKETTTQSDINLGIVNIIVGFAPLKPAEFVVIKLQQMAGQIQT
jgi:hypothetical protein